MRFTTLFVIGLTATTVPVRSQSLSRFECDQVVTALTELSRASAGMLIRVENMNVAPLRAGGAAESRRRQAGRAGAAP
jgi:hypothetical protein